MLVFIVRLRNNPQPHARTRKVRARETSQEVADVETRDDDDDTKDCSFFFKDRLRQLP